MAFQKCGLLLVAMFLGAGLPAWAGANFTVTAASFSDYQIDGQPDPTLDLVRGETYTFDINAPPHPFYIKTVAGGGTGNAYTNGVTGNGTTNGILTFTVPVDAPDTLYYNCSAHANMSGVINISDPPPDIHYVRQTGSAPTAPYTSWATAAASIQDAVDASFPGDTVLVSNGVYAAGGRTFGEGSLTNRVVIDKAITVRSENGPDVTIIQGASDPVTSNGAASVRCVWMTNGASLAGFTLQGGATRKDPSFIDYQNEDFRGGGVYAASLLAMVSNCVVSGNYAFYDGGGAFKGTLLGCTLVSNRSEQGQGGAASESLLEDCHILANEAPVGGGVSGCVVSRSVLAGNIAQVQHGGGAKGSQLDNCLLIGNRTSGGIGGGAYNGTLVNCTVVGNQRVGVADASVTNCIIYYNTGFTPGVDDNIDNLYGSDYTCTFPMPTNGTGNITNAPQFVDGAASNFQLLASSPCRDTGDPGTEPPGPDLAGQSRVVHGYPDMGAYEYQGGTGQGDYDEDGMGNGDEGVAGTDFSNQDDFLKLLEVPDSSAGALCFMSVTGRVYAGEFTENLMDTPQTWTIFTNNVSGTGEKLILVDPSPGTNRNYRLKVRLGAP